MKVIKVGTCSAIHEYGIYEPISGQFIGYEGFGGEIVTYEGEVLHAAGTFEVVSVDESAWD